MQFLFLNKRRMGIILFSLIISISCIKLCTKHKSVQTMAWTSEKKTIILDPGHGYPDKRSI